MPQPSFQPAGKDSSARLLEAVYDRTAPWYDLIGWLWLHLLARGAVAHFREAVAASSARARLVLDLGTGTGISLSLIRSAARPRLLVGLDRSTGMLLRAGKRCRGAPRVSLVRADVTQLPFRDGACNLVTSIWLLETTPDPQSVVREAVRVLAPGGRAVMLHSIEPDRRPLRSVARLMECLGRSTFRAKFLGDDWLPRTEAGLTVRVYERSGWAAVTVAEAVHAL